MIEFCIGGKYNWKNQPERLVYLGCNWSGNGYWHQFEKVEEPGIVWCEVLDNQLESFEETEPDVIVRGTSSTYRKNLEMAWFDPDQPARSERDQWNAAVERRKAEKKARNT